MPPFILWESQSPTCRTALQIRPLVPAALLAAALAACGSSATSTGFEVVAASGGAPISSLAAGDAVRLDVVETFSDGSRAPLPSGTTITWTAPAAVAALASDSTADSPFPPFGAAPTAVFISNAQRPDRQANLAAVLFVVDAGTQSGSVTVTATLASGASGTATATIPVAASTAGDAARGAPIYTTACSSCHGTTGGGSLANPDGSYTLDGTAYDFPAPGLNAAPDNLAGDPDWTPAMLAAAARADVDNGGIVLRAPMPDWLVTTFGGRLLTTQDFNDIYAYLLTQTQ